MSEKQPKATEATLDSILERLKILEKENADLRAHKDAGVSEATTLVKRQKHRLDHLDKYGGERAQWETWKAKAQTKLRIDGEAIGSLADQFSYLFTRLMGTAAQNVTTYYNHQLTTNPDPNEFLLYMSSTYGDPNRKLKAGEELSQLKQGKNSFAAFLPRFEKTLVEAGGAQWPDDVKILQVNRTLNSKMAEALIGNVNLPKVYTEYVQTLLIIGGQIDALRKPVFQSAKQESEKTGDEMDWEPIRANRQKTQDRKRAKWVSSKELEFRKTERLCIRCGGDGHFVRNCSYAPAARPEGSSEKKLKARKTSTLKEERRVDADSNSTDCSDEESGKE